MLLHEAERWWVDQKDTCPLAAHAVKCRALLSPPAKESEMNNSVLALQMLVSIGDADAYTSLFSRSPPDKCPGLVASPVP